jgi:hypothetical protein
MALGTASGRCAFGFILLFVLAIILRVAGSNNNDGQVGWLGRIFGIRDIVLGAGTAAAVQRHDGSASDWLKFCAFADRPDAVLAVS